MCRFTTRYLCKKNVIATSFDEADQQRPIGCHGLSYNGPSLIWNH